MTIASSIRSAGPYTTNGIQTVFPFGFKVFAAADLVVTQIIVATGVASKLVLTTNYTVALNADQDVSPGGTITTTSALSGVSLVITSDMAIEQPAVFTNQGGFYPRVLNDSLDRRTIVEQQLAEKIGRAVVLPPGETAVVLPSATNRAGKFLAFDGGGNPIPATGGGNDSALRTDVAASTGAGLVGFSGSVAYSNGSVGEALKKASALPGLYRNAIVFSEAVGYDTYGSQANQVSDIASTGTHTVPRAVQSISMTSDGSGANGPARADLAQSLFSGKANYPAPGVVGEIDGLAINVRQRNGDAAGILIDTRSVGLTSADFNAAIEAVAWQTNSAGGGVTSIRAFVAVNSGSGVTDGLPSKGLTVLADNGTNHLGLYMAHNGGAFGKGFLRFDTASGSTVFAVSVNGNPQIGSKSVATTPWIDWFSSGVTTNYDARTFARGGSATDGAGDFVIVAKRLELAAGGIGISIPEVAAVNVPAPAAGFQTLFIDTSDHKLKRRDASGTVTIIA